MNKSISSGEFPNLLKTAKVVSVFKKDDAQLVTNYRPIWVLSVFPKIIESIMHTRIIAFLEKYNFICSSQHSYRYGRSTETASVNFLQYSVNYS